MNIFALDDGPINSAIWQHDKHVVKMTLEAAQMLSQAIRLRPDWLEACPDPKALYGSTHVHHPCSKWVRHSEANLRWLIAHGLALADEYALRFGGRHASKRIIQIAEDTALALVPSVDPQSPFAMAMPDAYKDDDPVIAYRLYYLYEKCHVDTKWTRRDHLPDWLLDKALNFRPGAKRRKQTT